MRIVALLAAVFASAVALAFSSGPAVHATAKQTNDGVAQTVVVRPGDTLHKIAKAHGTTWPRLFYANTSINDPDLIYAGSTIRIPGKNEQLSKRPVPGAVARTAPVQQPVAQPVAPAPTPAPSYRPAAVPTAPSGGVWDRLAQCESGGNWHINTGNGYYGGLQFSLGSWQGVGGQGYPHQASKAEQISRAKQLLAVQGWGAWPACSAKLGLR